MESSRELWAEFLSFSPSSGGPQQALSKGILAQRSTFKRAQGQILHFKKASPSTSVYWVETLRVQAPAISALFLPPLPGPGAPGSSSSERPTPTASGGPRNRHSLERGFQDLKGTGSSSLAESSPQVRLAPSRPTSQAQPFPAPSGDHHCSPRLPRCGTPSSPLRRAGQSFQPRAFPSLKV